MLVAGSSRRSKHADQLYLARAQLSGKISARASLLIMCDAATSALFSLVCVVTCLFQTATVCLLHYTPASFPTQVAL